MVFMRFEGFMLALLLVSFDSLENICVHGVHHQDMRLMGGNSVEDTQEIDAPLNKGQEYNKFGRMTINPSESMRKQGFPRSLANPIGYKKDTIFSNEDKSGEWRKLLEDADKKVMQMMRKDYSGMRKPRRKPPVHNYEPKN